MRGLTGKRFIALALSLILFAAVFVWDIPSSFAEEPPAKSPSAMPTETIEPEPTELSVETPMPSEEPSEETTETQVPEPTQDVLPELPEDFQLPESAKEPAAMMEPCATSGDYDYTDNGDGTVTITGYHGTGGDITIPNELDGKTVTVIGKKIFSNNKNILNVVIPSGVTKIEQEAFYTCQNLNSIVLPNTLTEIGIVAFCGCESLSEINFPSSLKYIGYAAFDSCMNLNKVVIPNGLEKISPYAFHQCEKLAAIAIPNTVTSIGSGAFKKAGLVKALFWGNAPAIEIYSDPNGIDGIFDGCTTGFTVLYTEGALGFSNPWLGFSTRLYDPNILDIVTFDSQGGSAVPAASGGFDMIVNEPTAPTRLGYTFSGWYSTPECNTYPVRFPIIVPYNTTLYAKWYPIMCSVQYVTSGGIGDSFGYIAYDTILQAPPNPSRNDHVFAGWYLTPDTSSVPATFPYTVKGNTTFFAKWQLPGPNVSHVFLNAGTMAPAFAYYVKKYTIKLSENEPSLTLTPDICPGVTMTIDGKAVSSTTVSLANGKSKTVTIKVKCGRLSTAYKLTVTRAKSGDNNLASLTNSTGTMSQPFDPSVTNYTLNLDENTSSVTLKAAKSNSMAKVSPATKKLTLKNGQTKVLKFTVKAQSGAKKIYTVTVTRAPSTNTNLKTLKTNVPLSPGFSAAVTDYTVTLPAEKSAVTISAKAFDKLSKVTINGVKKASQKITLANGQSTTVSVVVTSQAGTTKEYRILVQRP